MSLVSNKEKNRREYHLKRKNGDHKPMIGAEKAKETLKSFRESIDGLNLKTWFLPEDIEFMKTMEGKVTNPWNGLIENLYLFANESVDRIKELEQTVPTTIMLTRLDFTGARALKTSTKELQEAICKSLNDARNAGLEEAADICDQENSIEGIAQKCAVRIRSLKIVR